MIFLGFYLINLNKKSNFWLFVTHMMIFPDIFQDEIQEFLLLEFAIVSAFKL